MPEAVREVRVEGYPALELDGGGELRARYVPGAGMLGASLLHRGEELLALPQGVAAYAERGVLGGLPLLHPWANRLSRRGFAFDGAEVVFPDAAPLVRCDRGGRPIHGLLAGCPDWTLVERGGDGGRARLVAELDFAGRPERLALFPFPHRLRMELELAGDTLRVCTRVRATGERPVPVAFGYHPYLRLPDVPRSAWQVELPVRTRAVLDRGCLPTGRVEAVRIAPGPLGTRRYDDLFPELEPRPVFALAGGGRRIEVAFGPGHPLAVVYAPDSADVVCFEPMTAPTDPFEGALAARAPLRRVAPGASFAADFAIRVR